MLEQFLKNCCPWEGPHSGARKQQKEERVKEMKCYELTTTPIAHSPVLLGWGGGRSAKSEGMKLSLGRRGARWKVVLVLSSFFTILLYF